MPHARARSSLARRVVALLLVGAVLAGLPASVAARSPEIGRLPAGHIDAGGATTVIVKYREGTSVARRAEMRDRASASRERSRPERRREVLRPTNGRSVAETIRSLLADPAVEYAEPNYPVRFAASPASEPLRSAYQWGLENSGGDCLSDAAALSCAVDVDIDATAAWPVSTGAGITIAVTDDGLDFAHPDLTTQAWTNPDDAKDGVDNDGNGFVDDIHGVNLCSRVGSSTELHDSDEDFHGTAVASVVGAATNDQGMAGVAPGAQLMAVRWLIDSSCMDTEMGATAIEYAVDEGADVINASWGSTSPSTTLLDAIHYAQAASVLIVAAAGNDPWTAFYPARYDTTNVLSVAAVAPSGYLGSFSNRGGWVDMAAPGEAIVVACATGACVNDAHWAIADGTSFAAPHVSGVAAQLLAIRPALRENVAALRSKLINSGVRSPKLDGGLTTSGRRLNARYALDVTAPSAPLVSIRAKLGTTIGATTTAMAIAWRASTDASGIESYRVRFRKAGTTAWTTVVSATTSLSAKASLAYDQPYEVQVTARDRGANTASTTVSLTPKRYSESSSVASYSGAWTLATNSSYQGGKARATTTAGRKARFDITGRSIAWIAATGPTRGSAAVWIDGIKVGSVSLYASSTSYRKVIWSKSWATSGRHAVTFVVSGTAGHPRVDVDAVIVAR